MAFPGKVICKWWIVQVYVTLPNWAHLRFFLKMIPKNNQFCWLPYCNQTRLAGKNAKRLFFFDFPSELNLHGSATGISRRDRKRFEPPTNICVKRAFSTLAIETGGGVSLPCGYGSKSMVPPMWTLKKRWSLTEPKPSLLAAFQDVFWWNLQHLLLRPTKCRIHGWFHGEIMGLGLAASLF